MEFEWDPDKAERNLAKHGISFAEAIAVFRDPNALSQEVARPNLLEERVKVIGQIGNRTITVVYTIKNTGRRIISARRSHRSERKAYGGKGTAE